MSRKKHVVERVLEALGGPSKAAAALSTNPSVVLNWRKREQVPANRVIEVERLTGISRHELRADIFGKAEEAA